MVHSIAPGAEAHGSDLWYNDYLVNIDGAPVSSLEQIYEQLAALRSAETVQLDFLRIERWRTEGDQFHIPLRRIYTPTMPEKVGAWKRTQLSRTE